jgi:hypothetical protein
MRAVLEFLSRHGPASVPQIARRRFVTRQHIQALVNGLMEQDSSHSNRTPLIAVRPW